MSTIKISQLTEKATMAGTEEVLINDSGTSKKFSTQRFLDVKTSTETARDAALAAQTAAETAETNAETAETNASGSATTAGTHATNASTSETNAATSETNAATSATSASGSATAAAASAASAAATYDTFDDRYLGNKASDPTTDNDGDALVQGMLYFDSTNNLMKVYDGSAWITTSSATLSTLDVYKFTATSGQTAFTGTDDDGNTLAIKPTAEMVTMNGIVLEPTADYTVTSSTLTLTTGATTGDEVNVYAFGNFELADHYSKTVSDARYLAKAGGTLTGNLSLADSVKATFGNADDLQIYHDGSNSYIDDAGAGRMFVKTNGSDISLSSTSDIMLKATVDGSVDLYHDNSKKLATTSTGIDVTGDIDLADNGKINLGNSDDLQIYHDGSNSIIKDSGAGNIQLQTSGQIFIGDNAAAETFATFNNDGAVNLYHNNNEKLATTSTGIDVTGRITTDGITEDTSGNVGIGTSSPRSASNKTLLSVDGAWGGQLDIGVNGISHAQFGSDNYSSGKGCRIQSKDDIIFKVNGGTERMRIDSSGNVGIGTSSPATLCQIGSTGITTSTATESAFAVHKEVSGGAAVHYLFNSAQSTTGSTSETSELHLGWRDGANGIAIAPRIVAGKEGDYKTVGAADSYLAFKTTKNNALAERMRIDSSGNVGIGTTSPSEKLYVSGNIYATGNITAYSDERIKENIVEIPNALDAVDNIRGVSYTRTDTKEDSVGVIAQEVEAMFPELITENNEGMKSVNYNGLVGVLFSAVKELSAKVKELEAK